MRTIRVCEDILAIADYVVEGRLCHACAEPALSTVERAGVQKTPGVSWIPACAGMTTSLLLRAVDRSQFQCPETFTGAPPMLHY